MNNLRFISCSATFIALLTLAPAARAGDNPNAQAHLAKATAHYNLQEWKAAIDEYRAAYQLDPNPQTLFPIAQAQRMSGDCRSAILSYRAYIRGASASGAHAAEDLVKECQKTIDEQDRAAKAALEPPRTPDVKKETPATPPSSAPAVKQAPAAPGPWILDPLGDVLVVVGVGGLAVGGTLLTLGNVAMGGSAAKPDYRAYDLAVDAASVQQTAGVVALIGGGVFAGLAVWRFIAVANRNARERTALQGLSVSPGPGGGSVSYQARF